jgi:3-oxoacyl-[acyl-carrier protein] reductase
MPPNAPVSFDLSGKTVLVTGGGTGIGRGIALGVARHGASVVVNYNRSKADAEAVAAEIESAGGKAIAVQADVSNWADVQRLFAESSSAFGRVDVLVNNAGGQIQKGTIDELSEDVWDRTIALNLKSLFLCCKAAIPQLPDKEGRIINITSISGFSGGGGGGIPYGAAKGAANTMTRGLAAELAPRGITVNAIAPGVIYTRQHSDFTTPDAYKNLIKLIPIGRDGKPEDIAGTVLLLASAEGGFITGEVINVNGGMRMV